MYREYRMLATEATYSTNQLLTGEKTKCVLKLSAPNRNEKQN